MAERDQLYSGWSPVVLSVLRMVAAFLFMQHGSQKLFGVPAGQMPRPEIFSLFGVAGILEFFGGGLLLIGFFTRPVALILSGEMAVAYFMMHQPQGLLPMQNRGEVAALYSFIFLYIAAAGGGVWSVDALLRKNRR